MMNKLAVAAFLTALSSGCIVYGTDYGYDGSDVTYASPGDVTFAWRIAGGLCSDDPGVKSIAIHIPGETLQNDGIFPCTAAGFQGITLYAFEAGTYSFVIDALDYWNEPVYTGSGTFDVDGDTRVNIDLTPVGSPSSYGYLSWSFPANSQSSFPNCSQAGATYVDVSIDGASPVRYSCSSGFGAASVQTPYLFPGTHTIDLSAVDSGGYAFYGYHGTLTTFSGSPVSADYSLNWAVGGVALEWSLISGGISRSCSTAGVQTVAVNFTDSNGNRVYGSSGDVQTCDSAPIVYNALPPGTYRVSLQGSGPGGYYLSNTASPIIVTVRAGQFATAAQAVSVPMYKQ